MPRRTLRTLTYVFLGLLLAAPLSSGDKGFWLSLIPTPVQISETAANTLPAEHAALLATRAARIVAQPRAERPYTAGSLVPTGTHWSLGVAERGTVPDPAPLQPPGVPSSGRPAPRAPPA